MYRHLDEVEIAHRKGRNAWTSVAGAFKCLTPRLICMWLSAHTRNLARKSDERHGQALVWKSLSFELTTSKIDVREGAGLLDPLRIES
jgi:hypothetical protein